MEWYWDNYLPDKSQRSQPAVSPLRASPEQLRDLPPALVITDENDVLRDEGEAYAHKLANAGVRVTMIRALGTCHDSAMLNPLSQTPAARLAIQQTNDALRKALHAEQAPPPAAAPAPPAAPTTPR
jgi:acetyl esterase